MWQEMRGAVIENFPESPGRPSDVDDYLRRVDDVYATDAYHSLSIEGYRVSPGLIDRVRSATWNPDGIHETESTAMRSLRAATTKPLKR
ncbi:hypothetical protein ACVDG8_008620 [Mesorhizobium sp. ORM8.1]